MDGYEFITRFNGLIERDSLEITLIREYANQVFKHMGKGNTFYIKTKRQKYTF